MYHQGALLFWSGGSRGTPVCTVFTDAKVETNELLIFFFIHCSSSWPKMSLQTLAMVWVTRNTTRNLYLKWFDVIAHKAMNCRCIKAQETHETPINSMRAAFPQVAFEWNCKAYSGWIFSSLFLSPPAEQIGPNLTFPSWEVWLLLKAVSNRARLIFLMVAPSTAAGGILNANPKRRAWALLPHYIGVWSSYPEINNTSFQTKKRGTALKYFQTDDLYLVPQGIATSFCCQDQFITLLSRKGNLQLPP